MIEYLTFGRTLESIKACDFDEPVPVDEPGLLHHLRLGPVGPINPVRVQFEDLTRLGLVLKRSQESVYYEWARLFSYRRVQFIYSSISLTKLWNKYKEKIKLDKE